MRRIEGTSVMTHSWPLHPRNALFHKPPKPLIFMGTSRFKTSLWWWTNKKPVEKWNFSTINLKPKKSFLVASHHVFNFLKIRFRIVLCSCLYIAVNFVKSKGIDHNQKFLWLGRKTYWRAFFLPFPKACRELASYPAQGWFSSRNCEAFFLKQHEDFPLCSGFF